MEVDTDLANGKWSLLAHQGRKPIERRSGPLWIGLAAFDARVLRGESGSRWIIRGLVAAVAGGVAFYAVSGVWTQHAENPNYGWHFVAWLIAWWPGLAALTFGRRRVADTGATLDGGA